MIPKLFHFICFSRELPPDNQRWMQSWLDQHPAWQHRVWGFSNMPSRLPHLERQFDLTPRLRFKANALQYELLLRDGGVFVDVSLECLKPIDELLEDTRAFCGRLPSGLMGEAILGCTPRHYWMQRIVRRAPKFFNPDVEGHSGPRLLTRCTGPAARVKVLEAQAFYPAEPTEESYAVFHPDDEWSKEVLDQSLSEPLRGEDPWTTR